MMMTTQELVDALAERGIDNAAAVVQGNDAGVIERAIAFWDRKRKAGTVGPGLLVEMIRRGGPTLAVVPTPERRSFEGWQEYVRAELPDLVERWPTVVDVLAAKAKLAAGGGWDVTPELLREFYERHWLSHVEAVEAER